MRDAAKLKQAITDLALALSGNSHGDDVKGATGGVIPAGYPPLVSECGAAESFMISARDQALLARIGND